MASCVQGFRCNEQLNEGNSSGCLVTSPEREVVADNLHDATSVTIPVLWYAAKLRDRALKRGASHVARFVNVFQHFVLKNGIIQSEAQSYWVCDCQTTACHEMGLLVSHVGFFCGICLFSAIFILSDITQIVGSHFLVENVRLIIASSPG